MQIFMAASRPIVRTAKDSDIQATGIQPLEPGYKSVKISPCDIAELGDFGGNMDIGGKLSVRVKRGEFIEVEVPDGIEAVLEFKDKKVTLSHGANRIEIK